MEDKVKNLLETYYKGFAEKSGWEHLIADDFEFTMNDDAPITGKQAYIEVIKDFSKTYNTMRVKQMIVEEENACVIGNYDYTFPNGNQKNGSVAEIWKIKNGKLQGLSIYFDTLVFQQNS